jgi:hypothetical protein
VLGRGIGSFFYFLENGCRASRGERTTKTQSLSCVLFGGARQRHAHTVTAVPPLAPLFCRGPSLTHGKGPLPCVQQKAHDNATLPCKILPCAPSNARQRLCRVFSCLCRVPGAHGKSLFPVVYAIPWVPKLFGTRVHSVHRPATSGARLCRQFLTPGIDREICYYDSPNNALCYYRTPNVDIVIIRF